jgi:hypothetical protein
MKKNLNEQISRIKGMMKKLNETVYENEDIVSEKMNVNDVIDKIETISRLVENIAEDFRNSFENTEYWKYVKKMYGGLRSVSDPDMNYTRTDQTEENFKYVIDQIKEDFGGYEIGEPSSVESDDYDEKMERNYGVDDEPLSRDEF